MNSAPAGWRMTFQASSTTIELGREVAAHGVPQKPEGGELGDRAHLRVAQGREADDEKAAIERERRPAREQVGERARRPALQAMGEGRAAVEPWEVVHEIGERRRWAIERRWVGADARGLVGRTEGSIERRSLIAGEATGHRGDESGEGGDLRREGAVGR